MQDHQHTGHSGKDTDVKSHAERQRRIRDDAVHSEMKHLAHGELRNTGVTGRRLKLDRSLLETKASDNAADKTAVFTELLESFQRLPVHQTEIRTAGSDTRRRNRIDESVVPGRSHLLHRPCILRRRADRLDDIIPLLPLLDQLRNQFRRMLHIPIHRNHCIPDGKIHTAGNGDLMSEIPGKRERPHMRVTVSQLMDQLIRPILRAIIDIDDLIIHVNALHDLSHFVMKVNDVSFFVINGCHD